MMMSLGAQAANDVLIYVVGLAASLSSGALLQNFGWQLMNLTLLPWLLATFIAWAWLGRASRVPAQKVGTST